LKKYSKGTFRVNKEEGIEVTGEFCPFLRKCMGISLLIFSTCLGLALLIFSIPWEHIFK